MNMFYFFFPRKWWIIIFKVKHPLFDTDEKYTTHENEQSEYRATIILSVYTIWSIFCTENDWVESAGKQLSQLHHCAISILV